MNERSLRLLTSIGEIGPDLAEEAAGEMGRKAKKKRGRRALIASLSAAAAAAVALAVGFYLIPTGGRSGGSNVKGRGGPGSYIFYEGPVLPLTLREADGSVSAQRSVTLDFSAWDEDKTQMRVLDSYVLTNASGEDRTVDILYPFIERFYDVAEKRPKLSLDGAEPETALIAGYYAGGYEGAWKGSIGGDENDGSVNMDYPDSWEDYRDLLAGSGYFDAAVSPYPNLTGVTAYVYDLTDPWYTLAEGQEAASPVLRLSFDLDFSKTRLLYAGDISGWTVDREAGYMEYLYHIPRKTNGSYQDDGHRTFIAVGEDPGEPKIQGYTSAQDNARPVEAGAAVTRREMDLEAYMRALALEEYAGFDGRDGRPDFETVFGQFKLWLVTDGPLAPEPKERYMDGGLWFSEVASVDRVMWLEAQITVPAGASVNLTAELVKEGSSDPFASKQSVGGASEYELATRVGSCLAFASQSATLEDGGKVEIVRQNFGFDPENGVRTVELTDDIYFLAVRDRANSSNSACRKSPDGLFRQGERAGNLR